MTILVLLIFGNLVRRGSDTELDVVMVLMPNKTCAQRNMSYDM